MHLVNNPSASAATLEFQRLRILYRTLRRYAVLLLLYVGLQLEARLTELCSYVVLRIKV